MRLLVAGGDRVDAGKTTFSVGLLERIDGTGFKPRAGNDYWFDHDDYRRAVEDGRMYGKDARRLAAASAGDPDVERINPVHRLWRPAPESGVGLVGQDDREFVLDRVAGSYVVNEDASVPASAREHLPVEAAVEVGSVAKLNAVTRKRHLPALRAVGRRLVETEPAVVESYGDVARPLQGTLDERDPYDAVAVVAPGLARFYDGREYVRACRDASGSSRDGSLERHVPDVLEALNPVASSRLPALGEDERSDPDAVAEAYADAYDALLDVARL